MKKASEVLGLKVIGIREGSDKGIVQDVVLNAAQKRVEYLILKGSHEYGFYALSFKDVLGMGADYATTSSIDNVKKIYQTKELLEAIENGFYILGAKVLTDSGNILGVAVDFGFSAKTGQIETLTLDNGAEYSSEHIAVLAGATVFVSNADAPFETAPSEAPKISELEAESIRFLEGKTVTSRVESEDGLFVAEEGTLLTAELLQEAAAHDALLMLTLNV
ncbi:MAG: PRC-barrel domain-containing protein [Bacillota bacterium]